MTRKINYFLVLVMALVFVFVGMGPGKTENVDNQVKTAAQRPVDKRVTPAQRQAAAARFKQQRTSLMARGIDQAGPAVMDPGGVPHYFGPWPNYANSPMPRGPLSLVTTLVSGGEGYTAPTVTILDAFGTGSGATATATQVGGIVTAVNITSAGTNYTAPQIFIVDATGTGADALATVTGPLTGGIRKFVDRLPGLNVVGANLLGQYIPVATPNKAAYAGSDYYEIEVGQFTEKLHTDLPATRLRGYRQVGGQYHSLGPLIVATRDTPVRLKFTNSLPTGIAGKLFLPVDTTLMGAGMGPVMGQAYTENRAELHLHGGLTPWISDGTPHQWVTPAAENTPYHRGISTMNVPGMVDPGLGGITYYYPNQQSARLMFYHDHAMGITRLNVYAGEAAGYLITDQVDQDLINGTNVSNVNPGLAHLLPGLGTPLVIQDRSFVDAATIATQDPTWNWGSTPGTPHTGDLWYPHVYMPNQNPYDLSGINAYGRWVYGPWFWPPTQNLQYGPIANPYAGTAPWEGATIPATPNPSVAMEGFMDTPMINGTLYPYMDVNPTAYRFRVLNAANDRFFNLQLYVADPAVTTSDGRTNTEVKMVAAPDGRVGGIPDPLTAGPSIIQIGTEGGFLPAPVVLPNKPIGWNLNPTNFNFGNVTDRTLLLGSAERADIIIDFSGFPGQTIILYNDAPAAFPALDPRYDYYTGMEDQVSSGSTPPTQPGFGPNTRTIMQFRVAATGGTGAYPIAQLNQAFAKTAAKRGVFEASQDPILIPSAPYNSAYNGAFPADTFARIFDFSKTFTTLSGASVTVPFEPKAAHDEMGGTYEIKYGRMMASLGTELPNAGTTIANFTMFPYISPPVDLFKDSVTVSEPVAGDGTQIWKITHNGVDTHPLHFHLYNVQVLNRVAWDNQIIPPHPTELGWKETVRMNPLEDLIVAMRPVKMTVPFEVPNSVRLIDPFKAVNDPLDPPAFGWKDPAGNPVTVTNHEVNFGWEYVLHCHILAHEEMDMMHAQGFAVAPIAPSGLTAGASGTPPVASLSWTDNSTTETGFLIDRATDNLFTTGLTSFSAPANATSYTDNTILTNNGYYYRVAANVVIGDTVTPGFPTKSAVSAFSNVAPLGVSTAPNPPTGLTAAIINNPTRVRLRWTDASTNEAGFIIERSPAGGAFVAIAQVGANVVTYNDAAILGNTTYTYQVRSFIVVSAPSVPSNPATVTTPQIGPNAPTNLRLNTIARTAMTLVWTDNANNERGFYIERSTDGVNFTRIATLGTNIRSYRVTGLRANTIYYFRVQAYNNSGRSAYTNTASAETLP